jgi:hypothetical protein
MGEFQNFAEMLEKKIRQELRSEMNQEATNRTEPAQGPTSVETSYPYMGWLLGQIPVSQAPKNLKSYLKTPYIQSKRPAAAAPRPPHSLSTVEQKAFECLKKYGVELVDGFNGRELRKAYRKALLATHPDHGGQAQALWEVRQAYDLLQTFLASITAKV